MDRVGDNGGSSALDQFCKVLEFSERQIAARRHYQHFRLAKSEILIAGFSKYDLGMTFLELSRFISIAIANIGITAYKFEMDPSRIL